MEHTCVLDNGISVGASVSLSQLKEFLEGVIEQHPEHQTRTYAALIEMLSWFAGPQIRNVAAVGGNIATGSPISDLNPLFMANRCVLTVGSVKGFRTITMNEDFFTGYRKTILSHDEVLVKIFVPFTTECDFVCGFKQSPRKEDDIAIVNAGMKVQFVENTNLVHDITLVFGGMAPTTTMAVKTMAILKGKNWDDNLLEEATKSLHSELALSPGVPGGMEVYRQSLTFSFFFKFYLKVLNKLNHSNNNDANSNMQEVPCGQPETDAVGRPIPLKSATQQTTGEAKYVDDLPKTEGELYVAFVFSEKAHAKIISMDFSKALALDGVIDVVSHEDVPGSNLTTPFQDEELFAVDEVFWVGQILALVVAENQSLAQRAAKLVKVDYEDLDNILTIKDAIHKESFLKQPLEISIGDTDEGFNQSDIMIEGECHVGAQEHFYMETMASIIIPKGEDCEMEIISSTQNITETQFSVAMALGIPKNRIVCRTKRLGGGFGGKESRSCIFSTAAAVAAYKVCKPVRYMLDRDEDMISTGTRHPFLGQYKVGFTNEGKLLALDLRLYSSCGSSLDLSVPVNVTPSMILTDECTQPLFFNRVLERALFHCDNVYKVPNLRVCGYLCKTNLPSCTAFRGFGAPQSMFIAEAWITAVANACGLPQEQVRELNFYKKGDSTHFHQTLHDWNLDRCWQSCLDKSSYAMRRKQVTEYNRKNRWKKRGLAITPTKFGISFTTKFLNQAGALVHIYTDGSVLVTHGGIEMGQGLHTKIIQVASRALGIPKERVHISETSTDKVPNTSPTAASTGSDLNGMAVQNACHTLLQRLEKYKAENPKGNWTDWVKAAYMDRTSLSATGFYKTPDITGYDWTGTDKTSKETRPFDYFCYGSAVSEVEIDCLTGDHQVLRADIVMDVGDSLNPAVDIGQVEGAFAQGYGLFVLEDYRYSPSGHLLTKGPGFYKIPSFGDIPKQLNVFLLDRSPNVRAVCSSKAVGEPPLFLAASVFFAIRDAISSARADAGLTGDFRLDSPACAERIRLACEDEFVKMVTLLLNFVSVINLSLLKKSCYKIRNHDFILKLLRDSEHVPELF
ncbi:Xanthine dehydrogenase/oxidase [Holothuria leucospilota]|uniref:Xanthine dehydrogenase/oxidase n=1 Tax=Holothuria leucospilota TaxID=206669 RepID=A0A9Q1HH41_HOLLE|nr:Xanthine dehydrogenase/oxidase [Holothuria leucospilota]